MQIGWLALAVAAGILIPVQAAINSKMSRSLEQPIYSTAVNFAVGTVILLAIVAAMAAASAPGTWKGALAAPWWAWLGGVLGVVFVTVSVLVLPRTGAAAFSMAMLAGQLIGAVALDHHGWMELSARPVNAHRLVACGLAVAAVWLMSASQEAPAS